MFSIKFLLKQLLVVGMLLSIISLANANVLEDSYNKAKDGAKKAYQKGKKAVKNAAENIYGAEKRSLKFYAKIGKMVIKQELKLINYLTTTPRYVVTAFMTKNRKRPIRRPDLIVSKLYRDKKGYVIVELKNIGRGFVVIKPKRKTKTVDLYFKINGKNWGGVTHKIFDPRARLVKPGGRVTYKTNLKITKRTKVTAIIDYKNVVIESNERNNAKTVLFRDKNSVKIKPSNKIKITEEKKLYQKNDTKISTENMRIKQEMVRYKPKPDLIINNIFLNKDCEVVVQVKNIGKGSVPEYVWSKHKPESSNIYLLRNGKNWGGATIYHIDKGKRLQKPGGRLLFRSNLKIQNKESITAIVDMTKQIKESNEKNNTMTKTLKCSH